MFAGAGTGGEGTMVQEKLCQDKWAHGCLSAPVFLVPIYALAPL